MELDVRGKFKTKDLKAFIDSFNTNEIYIIDGEDIIETDKLNLVECLISIKDGNYQYADRNLILTDGNDEVMRTLMLTIADVDNQTSTSRKATALRKACGIIKEVKPKSTGKKKTNSNTIISISVYDEETEETEDMVDTAKECIQFLYRQLILKCKKGNFERLKISINNEEGKTFTELVQEGIIEVSKK